MPHPNSGRMGRSPRAVPSIRRILSSSSCSRETRAMPPAESVRRGNAHPCPMNSSLTPAPSIELDRGTCHGDVAARRLHLDTLSLQGQRTRRLDAEAAARLHGDITVSADRYLAVATDLYLGLGFVERDTQVAISGQQGQSVLAGVIKEDDRMPMFRDEPSPGDGTARIVDEAIAVLRLVDAVVQPADDVRTPYVALFERDE